MPPGVIKLRPKYRFKVARQANLLGQTWKRLNDFAHANRRRFEEREKRKEFFGTTGIGNYNWSCPPAGTYASYGRFMVYYLQQSLQPDGSILEIFLDEENFDTDMERILTEKLSHSHSAMIEFLGFHDDQTRFYGRDLHSGKEVLYSPHDHIDWWLQPSRPDNDSCYMQIHRVMLDAIEGGIEEAVILTTPTFFSGPNLRSKALTQSRIQGQNLILFTIEKRIWRQSQWRDFCPDSEEPSSNYLQALSRLGEYAGMDGEATGSFSFFLRELELTPMMLEVLASDLADSTIAIPELEWVVQTLWNEQPRIPLWGKSPKMMQMQCNRKMLNQMLDYLGNRGECTLLPRHVLMARAFP